MAQSPFSVNPNSAGEIEGVQLRGQGLVVPEVNVLQEVADGLGRAAPFIVEHNKNKIVSAARGEIRSVALKLQAARFPSLKESQFSEEALANPVVKNSLGEFEQVQNAAKQGRIPKEFVLERLEAVTANAIARAPMFADEIRGAARDVLGFDPQSKFLSNLLASTPFEQAQAQLQTQAAKNGVTVQEQVAFNSQVFQNKAITNNLETLKAVNQYEASAMAQDTGIRAANALATVFESALQQLQAGGIRDVGLLSAQVDAVYASEINQLTANLPPGLAPATVNAHIATLTTKRDVMKAMIEDGNLQTILTTNNAILKQTAIASFAATDELLFAVYSIEPRMLQPVLGAMARFESNPEGFRLAVKNSREGAEVAGVLAFAQTITRGAKLFSGQVPASNAGDKESGSLFSSLVLQTPDMQTGMYATALDKLEELSGNEVTWNTLGDNKIATTVAQHKDVQGAVINIYNTELGALAQEFQQLQSQGRIPKDGFVFDNGFINTDPSVIQFTTSTRPTGFSGGTFASEFSDDRKQTAATQFAERFNRTVRIANKYSKLGVFGSSVYAGAENLLATLEEITPSEQPAEQGVQVWEFDENGVLNPVQ